LHFICLTSFSHPENTHRAPLDEARALEVLEVAAQRRPQRIQRARLLRTAVWTPLGLRAREKAREVLGLERGDVVWQVLRLEPGSEATHVPRVLRHRVRRAAVRVELGLEAGEGGGEAHGLEPVLDVATVTVDIDACLRELCKVLLA
jgi:hypothetical protein